MSFRKVHKPSSGAALRAFSMSFTGFVRPFIYKSFHLFSHAKQRNKLIETHSNAHKSSNGAALRAF